MHARASKRARPYLNGCSTSRHAGPSCSRSPTQICADPLDGRAAGVSRGVDSGPHEAPVNPSSDTRPRSAQRLAAGTLLTFSSSFGQTFFLSLFTVEWCARFALTSGELGLVYGGATLVAGLALPIVGPVVDVRPARGLALAAALALAAGFVALALAPNVVVLALAFLVVRFAGQGFLTHLAGTWVARTFVVGRGRALGVTALGYPLGEAVLPAIFVALLAGVGLTRTLLVVAALLACGFAPLTHRLLDDDRALTDETAAAVKGPRPPRFFVLRQGAFWLVLPFWVSTAGLLTAIFFHQRAIGRALSLDEGALATAFVAFAVGRVLVSFTSGPVIDRTGARRLFLFDLWPLLVGLALLVVALSSTDALDAISPAIVPFLYGAALFCAGASVGFSGNVKTAFLAETFGTAHLGAAKSSIATFTVLSTALAPPLTGALLDAGLSERDVVVALLAFGLVSTAFARVGLARLRALD